MLQILCQTQAKESHIVDHFALQWIYLGTQGTIKFGGNSVPSKCIAQSPEALWFIPWCFAFARSCFIQWVCWESWEPPWRFTPSVMFKCKSHKDWTIGMSNSLKVSEKTSGKLMAFSSLWFCIQTYLREFHGENDKWIFLNIDNTPVGTTKYIILSEESSRWPQWYGLLWSPNLYVMLKLYIVSISNAGNSPTVFQTHLVEIQFLLILTRW